MAAPIWLSLILLPALVASLAFGVVMIVGALKMMRLQSYRWAVAASILAILPCGPGNLLGLIMGVWALAVLNRDNVRAGFAAHLARTGEPGAAPAGRLAPDPRVGQGPLR